MQLHQYKVPLSFTLAVSIVFTLLLLPLPTNADHATGPLGRTGEEICRGGDELPDETDDGAGPGDGSDGHGPFGQYVPVYDQSAVSWLRAIEADLDAIRSDLESIRRDTDLINENTASIRYYLRQLCEKEYIHDHTIQHDWAEVIGHFVETTQTWVRNAYDDNPIFLTNQFVYYRLVDIAVVVNALIQVRDLRDEEVLGYTAALTIARSLLEGLFEDILQAGPPQGTVWSPDGVAESLAIDFDAVTPNNESSYRAFNKLLIQPEQNEAGIVAAIREEVDRRRARAFAYEQEKLAWGRGFFSYENCDLTVYQTYSGDVLVDDRRNCRIVTPGSLIQDQVSLVFGSAIRQMELADEFEEWIAPNTLVILNDILNWSGLDSDQRAQGRQVTAPASPEVIEQLIEEGTKPDNLPPELKFNVEEHVEQPPPPPPGIRI